MTKNEALQIITNTISECTLCQEISEYRVAYNGKYVPGEGNPNADIMILGEAPGQNEEEEGRPFVGRAGKLLDKIFEAAGWKREDLFICNILKCRPPNNRVPTKEEASNCRKFLDLQIKTINPKWILCLGKTATVYLLNKDNDTPMGKLRGQHVYNDIQVIASYHPSYLLRNPNAKQDVWQDIQPMLAK
jgi:DNA polymerase